MEDDAASDEGELILCDTCDIFFNSVKNYKEHKMGSKHLKKEKNLRNKSILRSSAADESSTNGVGEKEHSDDDQIECQLCDKTFSGVLPFKQHLKSGPHAKAEKRQRILSGMADPNSVGKVVVEPDDDLDEQDLIPKPYASCPTCKKVFSGPESYRDHLLSKQHSKKLKEAKYLKLLKESNLLPGKDGESVDAPGGSVETGTSENQIEALRNVLSKAAESNALDEDDLPERTYSCEQCDKSFSGPTSLLQHLVSKLHKKKLKQIKILAELKANMARQEEQTDEDTTSEEDEDEVLACMTCGMSFSGPESMMTHLRSKTHKKKIAFKKAKSKIMETVPRRRSFESKRDSNLPRPSLADVDPAIPDSIRNDQVMLESEHSAGTREDIDTVHDKSLGLFSRTVRLTEGPGPECPGQVSANPKSSFQMPDSSDNVDSETIQHPKTNPMLIIDRAKFSGEDTKVNWETTFGSSPSDGEDDPENASSARIGARLRDEAVRKRSKSNLEKVAGAVKDIVKEM